MNALARRPRKRLCDLSPATQAALVGRDHRFWRFLAERQGELVIDEHQARRAIMDLCGCRESRAEIAPGSEAGAAWAALFSEYQIWMYEAPNAHNRTFRPSGRGSVYSRPDRKGDQGIAGRKPGK
ncbi:MAG: hypothetical protein ACJ8EA_08680 [Xanthobacteraceae bacterium]